MPSKTPITPVRLDPQLKERALKVLAKFPGETLNGWINMILRDAVQRGEAHFLREGVASVVRGESSQKRKK